MIHHTRGIVLHHIRYSETSIIARVYTEKFGLQSYLIKGIRRSRSPIHIALFEHLSLLEMVVYHKNNRELQTIKEVQTSDPIQSIYADIRKSSQALFINEVISKSVKEEECNPALFGFLYDAVLALDQPHSFSPGFHLAFMAGLARFLGFAPRRNYFPGYCFNLRDGLFEPGVPLHPHFIEARQAEMFYQLLPNNTSAMASVNIAAADRKVILDKLIEFYQLHLPNFAGLHSPQVLHDVLGD